MGEHYETYRDDAYLRRMRPQMVSLMDLLMSQRDEHGFLLGRPQDWVFIGWADFDRDGPNLTGSSSGMLTPQSSGITT